MDRREKHDVGYWASIIGFATVISSLFFRVMVSADGGIIAYIAGTGFLVFLTGAELALRHGKHEHQSGW
ncbi:MAG: hypothetical protein ABEK10_03275 [Candidatus Nanosalina sp.]